jgi:hypothetical protein
VAAAVLVGRARQTKQERSNLTHQLQAAVAEAYLLLRTQQKALTAVEEGDGKGAREDNQLITAAQAESAVQACLIQARQITVLRPLGQGRFGRVVEVSRHLWRWLFFLVVKILRPC